jgi:hypothetical protein
VLTVTFNLPVNLRFELLIIMMFMMIMTRMIPSANLLAVTSTSKEQQKILNLKNFHFKLRQFSFRRGGPRPGRPLARLQIQVHRRRSESAVTVTVTTVMSRGGTVTVTAVSS